MEWASRSHVGRVRLHNEDNIAVHVPEEGLMVVTVADGMGGHQAGDVASQLASNVIEKQLRHLSKSHTVEELKQRLLDSMAEANARVLQLSQQKKAFAGMGTTLVVSIIRNDFLLTANVGDSRAYVVNERACKQITVDHSLVNELLNLGEITEAEAKEHPQRNILVRAVGTEPHVTPDVTIHSWSEGDYLLMCTDGLTNKVSNEMIHSIVTANETIEWKADELMCRALEAGGEDNVSLVLVKRTITSLPEGGQEEARKR